MDDDKNSGWAKTLGRALDVDAAIASERKKLDNDFYKEVEYYSNYSKKTIASAFGLTEADLDEGTYKIKTEYGPAATLSPIMPISKDEAAYESWTNLKEAKENDAKDKVLGVGISDIISKWDHHFEKKAVEPVVTVHGTGNPDVWTQLQAVYDNYDKGITTSPKKAWAKSIMPGFTDVPPLPPSVPLAKDAYPHDPYSIGTIEARKAAKEEAKPKKPRYPAYKKNDRVNTPNGAGNVWSVDKDGTVCVELDSDPSILHEFEKKELKKIKK